MCSCRVVSCRVASCRVVSCRVVARYETTFHFLKEFGDTGKLSVDQLLERKDYMSLLVNCGNFSYSEIPKRYLEFGCIVGVSGTLETMVSEQKLFMKSSYNLVKFSIIPCAYGEKDSRIEFCKDVPMSIRRPFPIRGLHIVPIRDKFVTITEEILCRLKDDKSNPLNDRY